ncbi:MAG: hypothetical protein AAGH89_02365 [Verrucomicrobiota bacterium]
MSPPRLRRGTDRALDLRHWLADPKAISVLWEQLFAEPISRPLIAKHADVADKLMPLLPGLSREQMERLDAAVSKMAYLPPKLDLLAEFAGTDRAVDWCEAVAEIKPHHREFTIETVLRFRVFDLSPPHDLAKAARELESLTESEDAFHILFSAVVRAWLGKTPPHYTIAGICLDRESVDSWKDWSGPRLKGEIFLPKWTFTSLKIWSDGTLRPSALWGLCGKLPGYGRYLQQIERAPCQGRVKTALTRISWGIQNDRDRWRRMQPFLPRLIELTTDSVPESHVERFVDFFRSLAARLAPSTFEAVMDDGLTLGARICRQPFSKQLLSNALPYLIDMGTANLRRSICHAPDVAFKHLDKACRSDYAADPIDKGLSYLGSCAFIRTIAFSLATKPLLETARRLGAMEHAQANRVLAVWKEHPLICLKPSGMNDEALARLVENVSIGRGPDPIPKALRAHWDNGPNLSEARYKHYQAELRRNYTRLTIQVLDELIDSELARISPSPALDHHSILMTLGAEDNKRGIRRFLRTWPNAPAPLDAHPNNRKWLATNLNRRRETWENGLNWTVAGLDLGFEDDPREVLQIGTRVGSCLGLGGCNSHAASALLLDANKRVIVARDSATGEFVARQILAITTKLQLACFPVYPLHVARRVERLFLRYDLELGRRLEIPICQEDEPDVELIVAKDTYLDDAIEPSLRLEELEA